MKIPVNTSLFIKEFSGGNIIFAEAYVKNGVFDQYPNKTWFVNHRPGINIYSQASKTVSDAKGRGIYYWNAVGASYFVNAATVYKGDYGAPLGVTLTTGTERVYMVECGNYLVIIDPENNEGWTIAKGASTTLVKITDVDFPGNIASTFLAKGAAVLDGTLYVMDTNGVIYGSDLENPTSWNALNFITSEMDPDGGVFIGKHQNHVTAFGPRSTQFFYDAANPTGSPLTARKDIFHEVGMANYNTVWSETDAMFYVGMTPSGGISVFKLDAFQVKKISTSSIDSYLTTSLITEGFKIVGSGFVIGGKVLYVITLYNTVGTIYPLVSLVYESITDTWGMWEIAVGGVNKMPIVSWTTATTTRVGEGILSNGDLINASDNKTTQDTLEGSTYIDPTYIDATYFSTTGGSGNVFTLEIVTGQYDMQTRNRKFMSGCRYIGMPTVQYQPITVSWMDDNDSGFNSGEILDTSLPDDRINRMGSFRQRNFKLSYSGSEFLEVEGLEANVVEGVS